MTSFACFEILFIIALSTMCSRTVAADLGVRVTSAHMELLYEGSFERWAAISNQICQLNLFAPEDAPFPTNTHCTRDENGMCPSRALPKLRRQSICNWLEAKYVVEAFNNSAIVSESFQEMFHYPTVVCQWFLFFRNPFIIFGIMRVLSSDFRLSPWKYWCMPFGLQTEIPSLLPVL